MAGVESTRLLSPMVDTRRLNSVLSAIGALNQSDVEQLSNWKSLQAPGLKLDGIEGLPSGVFESGKDKFEVSATVYVALRLGASKRALTMTDSYPALVRGVFHGETPIIERVDIDFRPMDD